MDKVKRNKLHTVWVWRGSLSETRVTFFRDNREERAYYPTYSSFERLQPHLQNCTVAIAPGYIFLKKLFY